MLPYEIIKLYWDNGLSATEIGKIFKVTKWQVLKRMIKYGIPRRKQWETIKIQYEKQPLSYKLKIKLTPKEQELQQAALMLYWAEGSKRSPYSVDLANSDEKMEILFLKALRNIYNINEAKLRVYLYCYANQNIKKLIDHWSKLLDIPESQFTKPYVRKDFDPNKIKRMPFGMIHLRYADKKLLVQIKTEIDIIQRSLTS